MLDRNDQPIEDADGRLLRNQRCAWTNACTTFHSQSHSIPSSPWLYYKLVNVQSKPINKQPGINYTGSDAATFYQANIVVETDYTCSFQWTVSAHLKTSPKANVRDLITDFNLDGTPFFNTYCNGTAFNMGGCMGCPANAQSLFGSDLNFIMVEQRVPDPESVGPSGVAAAQRRFDRIFKE